MMFDAPDFQSRAEGVGSSSCSTWSASVGPWPPARRFSGGCDPPLIASCAVGVFSSLAASLSVVPECAVDPGRRPAVAFLEFRESATVGVGSRPGEDEHTLAEVAGPDPGRARKTPLRIEPEGGKVTEDSAESPSKVAAYVLQHDEAGS